MSDKKEEREWIDTGNPDDYPFEKTLIDKIAQIQRKSKPFALYRPSQDILYVSLGFFTGDIFSSSKEQKEFKVLCKKNKIQETGGVLLLYPCYGKEWYEYIPKYLETINSFFKRTGAYHKESVRLSEDAWYRCCHLQIMTE